jgi:hypothetical protein
MPPIDLDDIEPYAATELVRLQRREHRQRGGTTKIIEIEVRGISIREYAALVRRFPAVESNGNALLTAPAEPTGVIDRADKLVEDLDVALAVVAIGLNSPGDKAIEGKIEAKFSEQEIKQLFEAVMTLTRPPSAGPLEGAGGEEGLLPGSQSPGRAADGALSSPSTHSSTLDTSATM